MKTRQEQPATGTEKPGARSAAPECVANQPDTYLAALGLRIKHARKVRELKLKELAEQCGWSESMLSKVERGLASPSLTALHKLAQALGTNVGELTAPAPVSDSPVMRAADRPRVSFGPAGGPKIDLERLVIPQSGLLLQADVHVIGPHFSSEEEINHVGEELGYVLEGRVELRVGDEVYELAPGDSFHFRSERPHAYRNLGDTVARIIWINTPPTF